MRMFNFEMSDEAACRFAENIFFITYHDLMFDWYVLKNGYKDYLIYTEKNKEDELTKEENRFFNKYLRAMQEFTEIELFYKSDLAQDLSLAEDIDYNDILDRAKKESEIKYFGRDWKKVTKRTV